jgi:multiple sugar transport system substrate-binding protein
MYTDSLSMFIWVNLCLLIPLIFVTLSPQFMHKKLLLFIALYLVGLITFTGCSAVQQTAENDIVTIRLSGWTANPNERQQLQEVLNNFEAQHQHIKVKYEAIADQYMDVMKTRLIGGTAADVFYLDAFEAPAFMKYGVLEPLDSYIQPDFDMSDFVPRLLSAFQYQSNTYGLPKDFSTLALFYNQKALEAAGISELPQTWEQLRVYAKKLTIDNNKDGKIDQYGFGIAPELARQVFMIQAYGGELVNANGKATFASKAGLKGLQILIDMYRKDKSSVQPSDVGTNSGIEMFGQGRVAMVIEGAWAIPYFKETFPKLQYATAEVPKVNNKQGTMAFTVAYVMNKQSKHKQAAWELIEYLTGKEGMKLWTQGGFALPTRASVAAELGYDNNPLYSPFVAGAAYATIWQASETLPTILNNFNNQFISALLGEQPLSTAMEIAQATANKEIALAE